MTTRTKLLLIAGAVALAFVVGLTLDWWWPLVVAPLLGPVVGRGDGRRDSEDPTPDSAHSADHRPNPYTEPDYDIADALDAVDDARRTAAGDAARRHDVDPDTVAEALRRADAVRESGDVLEPRRDQRDD